MKPTLTMMMCLALASLLCSCEDSTNWQTLEGGLAGQVLVLNSGSGTNSLSLCDPGRLQVQRDVAPTALLPNHAFQQGDRLFVTCSGDDRIVSYALGDSSLEVLESWSLNALDGRQAGELVYTPWSSLFFGGEIYTSLSARNEISAIPETGDSLRAFATGSWPQGLCLSGDTLYVACTGFSLSTLEFGPGTVRAHRLPSGEELWSTEVGANPQRLALTPAGELLVLCSGDYVLREGQLVVLDPRNGAESWNLPLGDFPGAMALDGRDLWLAAWGQYDLQPGGTQEGHVTRVSLDQRAFDRGPENPWRVQAGATDLCLAGGRLFVSCYAQDALCVIQGDSLLECLPVGHGPGALLLLE